MYKAVNLNSKALAALAIMAMPVWAQAATGYVSSPNAALSILNPAGTQVGNAPLESVSYTVLFSADGKTAWVSSGTGNFDGIDVATHAVKFTLALNLDSASPVLSPDGARIYAIANGVLTIVDPNTGAIAGTVDLGPNQGRYLTVSPDSAHVYISSYNNTVVTVNAATLQVTNTYTIAGAANIAALPDNATAALLTITTNGTGPILRLNLATGTTTTIFPDGGISSFILTANGLGLIALIYPSPVNASQIDAINVATGEWMDLQTNFTANNVCVSPNGADAYFTGPGGLMVWNYKAGTLNVNPVQTGQYACAVTPDSSRVWVANSTANQISRINTETGKLTGALVAITHPGNLAITPDGKTLFAAESLSNSFQGPELIVFDTSTEKQIAPQLDLDAYAMAVSPDGTKFVTATKDSQTFSITAVLIDVATLSVVSSAATQDAFAYSIAFSPDSSKYYLSGANPSGVGTVTIFDSATNAILSTGTIQGLSSGMVVSPDGTKLYVGMLPPGKKNTTVAIVDAASLQVTAVGSTVVEPGFVLSADGSTLFGLGGTTAPKSYTVEAIDAGALAVNKTTSLTGHNSPQPPVLALGPGGTQLYISEAFNTLLVNTSDLSLAGALPQAAVGAYVFGPQ